MTELSRLELYLEELEELVTDPIHKRLLAAYTGDKPSQLSVRKTAKLPNKG